LARRGGDHSRPAVPHRKGGTIGARLSDQSVLDRPTHGLGSTATPLFHQSCNNSLLIRLRPIEKYVFEIAHNFRICCPQKFFGLWARRRATREDAMTAFAKSWRRE
jgi:hypothetical protein